MVLTAGPPSETTPNNTDSDPPRREFAQWLAAFLIVSGVALVFLKSFGVVSFDDSTFRYFLIAGIILTGGREAIKAVAQAFA